MCMCDWCCKLVVCTIMCVFEFLLNALNGICVCFKGSPGPSGPPGLRGLTGQKGAKGEAVCFCLPLFFYIACKLFYLCVFCVFVFFVKCQLVLSMNVCLRMSYLRKSNHIEID